MKKIVSTSLKVGIPLLISAVILYFTYRDYDFSQFGADMSRIKWFWLLAAVSFSALGPVFRGLRWNQLLEPIGYDIPKRSTILTVFTGYAANIIIPRVGEISRCAILENHDKVPFSKSLGTLVAERCVDAILLGLIVGVTFLTQMGRFHQLFAGEGNTGEEIEAAVETAEASAWSSPLLWIGICIVLLALGFLICRKLHLWDKIKKFFMDFWAGFLAIKQVRNLPLFIVYSVSIWICYYLELYMAFYCLPTTAAVGPVAGLVCYAASSVAVLVPTPNGLGPWNWVIISMLVIYGVPRADAQPFAAVLHAAQTCTYLFCGFVAWIMLPRKEGGVKVKA